MAIANQISIRFSRGFTRPLQELRKQSYGLQQIVVDPYDCKSEFLVARVDENVVGMLRATDGSHGMLETWHGPFDEFPLNGLKTLELSRPAVSRSYIGLGLYRLLTTEAILRTLDQGFKRVLVPVEPDFIDRSFLEHLGFRSIGKLRVFHDWPFRTEAKLFELTLDGARFRMERHWQRLVRQLEKRGVGVRSSLGGADRSVA